MCTLVLLRRPSEDWPVIIAANRDEMVGRPCRTPGRWWEDRPEVVAGLDEVGGGSWLGMNHTGVTAAILNRMGTLGPEPGKRSRGELVLEALDHADAAEAAEALAALNPSAYRPFNLVVADNRDAFWLRADGRRIERHAIAPGLHMLSALDLDDPTSPRIRTYRDRFLAAPPPRPEPERDDGGDWAAWAALMADHGHHDSDDGSEEDAAMCFSRPDGFGTVSSALIALPAMALAPRKPVWRFASGRPDQNPYQPVTLP